MIKGRWCSDEGEAVQGEVVHQNQRAGRKPKLNTGNRKLKTHFSRAAHLQPH